MFEFCADEVAAGGFDAVDGLIVVPVVSMSLRDMKIKTF